MSNNKKRGVRETAKKCISYVDEDGLDDKVREQIEKSARHLFGLIHARFVITSRGLVKMVKKKKIHVNTPCY